MHRTGSRTLLLGGLIGLLAACGEVPGGAGGISGTVTAPAGGNVVNTDVSACFNNEAACGPLSVTITQTGLSASYRLSVPSGSYGVYAFKDSDGDSRPSNGDLYAYYSTEPGNISLVRSPATGIDISMSRLTGTTPATVRESLAKIASDK